jgi:flagellar biosynthesis protein FlhF
MSVKRYFGLTSRDAIRQVRAELGDEAVILSNRKVDGGVEVLASAQDDINSMIDYAPRAVPRPATATAGASATMPTLARVAQAAAKPLAVNRSKPENRIFQPGTAPVAETFERFVVRSEQTRVARAAPPTAPVDARPVAAPVAAIATHADRDPALMAEIQSMKSLLQEQMGAMSWMETTRRRPLQAKKMSHLLAAGFSPALARALTDKLPADFNEVQAGDWLQENLVRNMAAADAGNDLVDRGGVYALVGPTGVGKTTTTAKLAAKCVVKYGAKKLGLITVDSYRIGAEDQLRTYGKILGVTVHTARDAQTLADLISLMRDKHLILIDTVGMGQRDSRVIEQMEMLNSPAIERVLVLNASAQAETLDDVIGAYRGEGPRRIAKVILSKIDEAVRYGVALDCLVRHKFELQFVTNGQRVPEDLHSANPQYLVHRAMKYRASATFALDQSEIPLLFSQPAATGADSAGAAGGRHV